MKRTTDDDEEAGSAGSPTPGEITPCVGSGMPLGVGGVLDTVRVAECIEFMAALPNACVDAVIADLPYGTTACAWDAVIPFDSLWGVVRRVLKPCGAVVLTASQPFTTDLIASNRKWFKYCWVWEKKATGVFLAKRRPMQGHEDIAVFGLGAITYNPQMEDRTPEEMSRMGDIKRTFSHGKNDSEHYRECKLAEDYDPRKKYPKTVIRFPSVNSNSGQRLHPTQKPIEMMRYLVRTYTNPGDVVLDMCCGSGTTLLAAKQEGRHYIGCDREAKYVEIARGRLASEFFMGGGGGSETSHRHSESGNQ